MSAFVLSSCIEAQKVTDDMLVGKWNCKLIVDKTNDLNTNSLELKDVPIYDANKERAYEKENDLIILSIGSYKSKPFKFQSSDKGEYKEFTPEPGYEVKSSGEYVFISTNEFKRITDASIRNADTKEETIKNYQEQVCTRIID